MSATAFIILLVLAAAVQGQTPSGCGAEEGGPVNVTERTALERRQAMVRVKRHITSLSAEQHNVAPVTQAAEGGFKTTVDVILTLASVLQLSDVRQTMTTSLSLLVTWVDTAISWNASEYGGVDTVEVGVGDVWMPDLYILNTQEDSQNVMRQAQHVKVASDGAVTVTACTSAETMCHIDHSRFPFDTQSCNILVFSYSDLIQVNLTSQPLFHQIAQSYAQKNEWNLQKLSDATSYIHTNITGRVAMPMVQLVLSRKTTFYAVCLVLPLVLTSYMNTLVFLIPLESGEKVSFIVSIFVSTSVFSGFFSGSMPRGLDTVPATMQLMAGVVVESFLVLLCTLFVLVRHHGSRPDGAERDSLPRADSQAGDVTTCGHTGHLAEKAGVSEGDNINGAGPEVTGVIPDAGLEWARAARQPGGKGRARHNSTVLLDRVLFVVMFVANTLFLGRESITMKSFLSEKAGRGTVNPPVRGDNPLITLCPDLCHTSEISQPCNSPSHSDSGVEQDIRNLFAAFQRGYNTMQCSFYCGQPLLIPETT
ncbi:neuronal acetylcholine receptor subunit alpha-7-like [Babylonia areolata]|uniref:neuronal acetylcholine receptor subunit alpha-7-like n=1 Tax=Babylonia areolata TaxID=304850 RepID=UPI003FD2B0D7